MSWPTFFAEYARNEIMYLCTMYGTERENFMDSYTWPRKVLVSGLEDGTASLDGESDSLQLLLGAYPRPNYDYR